MKTSSCCHATYIGKAGKCPIPFSVFENDCVIYVCDKCKKECNTECTLEDTPESLEERVNRFIDTQPVLFGHDKRVQLKDFIKSERELLVERVKKAFIEHFHKSGEQWFNYFFRNKEEENDALEVVEEHWNDIIKLIREK